MLDINLQNECILNLMAFSGVRKFDKEGLKKAYREAIALRNPELTISTDSLDIQYVLSGANNKSYASHFNLDSMLSDYDKNDIIDSSEIFVGTDIVEQIIKQVETFKLHPKYGMFFELFIHTIYFAKSKFAGTGTSNSALGVIWVDPRENWTDLDFQEALLHELTHTLIFFDDLCRGHYSDFQKISDSKNWVKSAIRHSDRPLDKVFHSIVVAFQILNQRNFSVVNGNHLHPQSDKIYGQLKNSLDEIIMKKEISGLLTSRAKEILTLIINKMQSTSIQQMGVTCF